MVLTMADFGWSYPPGVTGNEPQISGVMDRYAAEDLVSEAKKKIRKEVEELTEQLDDSGYMRDHVAESIEIALENLEDELNRLPL